MSGMRLGTRREIGRLAVVAVVCAAASLVTTPVPAGAGVGAESGSVGTGLLPAGCTWVQQELPGGRGHPAGTDGFHTIVGRLDLDAVVWTHGRLVTLDPGYATDANLRGEVVGASQIYTDGQLFEHPALWRGGRMIELARPVSTGSGRANGINNAGLIVGGVTVPTGSGGYADHAVVWSDAHPDRVLDLGTLDGVSTHLEAVNEQGVFVGTAENQQVWRFQAVIGSLRAGLRPLQPLRSDQSTDAYSVAGRYVVGDWWTMTEDMHPMLWVDGRPTTRLSGIGQAHAVNTHGLVAGRGADGGPVVWLPGRSDPVALPGGGSAAAALAVTEENVVVGVIGDVPVTWTCR